MKLKAMFKHIVASVLAGTLLVGCLTGCGNDNKQTTAPAESTSPGTVADTTPGATEDSTETEAPAAPSEITYYGKLLGASSTLTSLNDMEIMKVAGEATNCLVTYISPSSASATEDFNLRINSKQLEDIMEYTWTSYPGSATQAINDGIIIDLAPYLEMGYAPNYKKLLDENPDLAKQVTTDEGHIYAFACIGAKEVSVTSGYIVRQDFLDAVGLDAPETIADWEEMLTAFKNKLGLAAPFTGQTAHLFGANAFLAGAFGTISNYYVKDGKVQYGILDEGYKNYIATMADWYAKGLIDPEIFGNDSKVAKSNILNDKSGVFYGAIGGGIGTYTQNAQANKDCNPKFTLAGLSFPVLKEGDEPQFMGSAADVRTANQAAITTACEDIEGAMRYLDYWYSEEGHLLKNFGIENMTYTMVNGVPTYTDLILKNPEGHSVSVALGRYTRASQPTVGMIDINYYRGYYELKSQVDAMETWNEYAENAKKHAMPPVSATSDESEELASITASVNTYVEEELTKFVMGTRSMSEWDSFIASLKGMDIDRAIALKQAAYDRYQAR